MRMKYGVLAAAAIALVSTAASAVDFGGYTRIGPGQKQNSGDGQRCFAGGNNDASAAPGHGGIGRLGNECNTYGEFGLSQGADVNGVNYKALLMTNFYSPGSTPTTQTDVVNGHDNTPRVEQLYLEAKGFDVYPKATFWIGRRFYHRADVHFDDSFYLHGGLANSTGAGIDEIDTGAGSLGVAVFRSPDDSIVGASTPSNQNPGTLLNIDLQKIPTNPGGQFRVTAAFSKYSGPNGKSGGGISFSHVQSGIAGGLDNTLFLQYAQGTTSLDMGFSGAPTSTSDVKGWRIADSLAWLNGPLTYQTLFHYGHVQAPNGTGGTNTTKTASAAGRVAFAFTKNFKLQGELGTASFKPQNGGASQNVTKLTVAPTLAVGPNYYDRPELRFYVSSFSMNNAYALANGQTKKTKTAAGFQLEVWF